MSRAVDPTPKQTRFSEALSSLEPEPSGLHPESLPQPRREREGLGVTYLLGHQAGDAHGPPHPAFLDPGLQGPCPARLPGRGRHGGLGHPQPACPGAPGPASTSPAPQQQSQPRLRPRDWWPGSQGSLWHEASCWGWAPGLGSPWQWAWTVARLARAAHGPLVQAPLPGCCALPAASPAAAPRSEPAPPAGPSSSQVPTPTPPARPAAPSPAAAPGSCCSRSEARSPYSSSSSPSSLACHCRLMGSLTPPPRRSSAQPVRQTPGDGESARSPETGRARNTHTLTRTRTRTDRRQGTTRCRPGSGAGQTPRLQVGTTERRGAGGGHQEGRGQAARYGAWRAGECSGLKAKGLETWQGPREPEVAGAGPGAGLRKPGAAAPSRGPIRGAAVAGAGGAAGTEV